MGIRQKKIFNSYLLIPRSVRNFLSKACIVFIAWKIMYLLFLINNRILDAPLTSHVGSTAVYILNNFSGLHNFKSINISDTIFMEGQIQIAAVTKIVHNNKKVLHIADGCNGLELMVIYAGFIFCFPVSILKKAWYIFFGLIIIDAINISRCSFLGFIKEYYHPYFNFSHHFIFKVIVYSVIVALWVRFTRKTEINAATL